MPLAVSAIVAGRPAGWLPVTLHRLTGNSIAPSKIDSINRYQVECSCHDDLPCSATRRNSTNGPAACRQATRWEICGRCGELVRAVVQTSCVINAITVDREGYLANIPLPCVLLFTTLIRGRRVARGIVFLSADLFGVSSRVVGERCASALKYTRQCARENRTPHPWS